MDLGKALPEPQAKSPRLSKSPHCSTSPGSHLKAVNFQTNLQSRGREEPADSDVPVDSPVLLEKKKNSEFQAVQRITRDDQRTKSAHEESCDGTDEECNQGSSEEPHEANSSPQFCSKHQRWVKSILQECPEECSDDLLRQPHASVSPPLFQSSSPRPSSEDLTPSDLVPCQADQQRPASDASSRSQTPEKTCEKANSTDHMTSGSSSLSRSTSEGQPALQPSAFREAQMPVLSLRLQRIDVASAGGPEPPFRASPNGSSASPRHRSPLSRNRAPTSLQRQSSGNRALPQGATPSPLEDMKRAETDPGGRSASTSTVKERLAANTRQPSLSDGPRVSVHPTRDASASADTRIAPPTENVPVSSTQHTHASDARQQTPLRLSLPSQAVLLQSKLLQPCVSLPRLSPQHCHQATSGRSSTRHSGGDDEGTGVDEEEDSEASLDINRLYSSHSSGSSVGEDSTLWDSDYEPRTKKKRGV